MSVSPGPNLGEQAIENPQPQLEANQADDVPFEPMAGARRQQVGHRVGRIPDHLKLLPDGSRAWRQIELVDQLAQSRSNSG